MLWGLVNGRGGAVYANETAGTDPRFGLVLLSMATALLLVTHPPKVPDISSGAIAFGGADLTEHVMEWRPQGPPPWGDVDQLSPDEVEESAGLASGERGRDASGSSRARQEL